MLTSLASVFFVFGLLGGLLWLLRRCGGAPASGRHIELVETVPIAPGKSLSVVKVGGRAMLLSTTSEAVHLLSELDPCEIESRQRQLCAASAAPRPLFPRRWLGRASLPFSKST